jgi:hypothetical protein
MRFYVPEGTNKFCVQGQDFEVTAGTVDVPAHFAKDMLAHGCKPAGEKMPEIETSDFKNKKTGLAKPEDLKKS